MSPDESSEIDARPEFQNLAKDASQGSVQQVLTEGLEISQLQEELNDERLVQSIQTIFILRYWFVLSSKQNLKFYSEKVAYCIIFTISCKAWNDSQKRCPFKWNVRGFYVCSQQRTGIQLVNY